MNTKFNIDNYKKLIYAEAEYKWLLFNLATTPLPSLGNQQIPTKQALMDSLRLLLKKPAFHDLVNYIRERFWIPPFHLVRLYSSNPKKDNLSIWTNGIWIKLERLQEHEHCIEVKIGGMELDKYDEWADKLLSEKSDELKEPQMALLRLHIMWLLNEFKLPEQFGQAIEQYIIFGYADPIPPFEIHTDGNHGLYQSKESIICIQIFDYTTPKDIRDRWYTTKPKKGEKVNIPPFETIEDVMKRVWNRTTKRYRALKNPEQSYRWYKMIQEGKKPRDIAELEIDTSYGEIDETIIRSRVNRVKKKFKNELLT